VRFKGIGFATEGIEDNEKTQGELSTPEMKMWGRGPTQTRQEKKSVKNRGRVKKDEEQEVERF